MQRQMQVNISIVSNIFKHSYVYAINITVTKVLVGDELDTMHNTSNLTFVRPCDRGYIVNMACQIEIWQYLLDKKLQKHGNNSTSNSTSASNSNSTTRKCDPKETLLFMTEAPFTPTTIQNDVNEVIFEEFDFYGYSRKPSAFYSAYEFAHNSSSCSVFHPFETSNNSNDQVKYPTAVTVIDSGFSFTHCFPFIDSVCNKKAVKRLNIGGKLLTNYLKELISYRQYNMMDEFLLIQNLKEELCYVSNKYNDDILNSKYRPIISETNLPLRVAPSKPAGKSGIGMKKSGSSNINPVKKRVKPTVLDHNNEEMKKLYVLPDYHTIMRGYVKDDQPLLPHEQVGGYLCL